MPVATFDARGVGLDGRTRKIKMQDGAGDVRLVQLPAFGALTLTVGPSFDATGAVQAGTCGYALGAASTFTNDTAAPAVADQVVRADLAAGESRSLAVAPATTQLVELAVWSSVVDGYVEVTFEPPGGVR